MTTRVEVRLCLGRYSEPIYESLLCEASQSSPKRAEVSVSLEGECVTLSVSSSRINAARSVVNSYLYLVYAMLSSLKSAES